MLVRLTSSTSGEMIMVAEHAHDLFGWMGKECVAHGVFTEEQLPEAIASLYQGVEKEKQTERKIEPEERRTESQKANAEDKKKEVFLDELIPLGKRAQPLIRLMERTLKEKGFVTWEAAADF